MLRSMFPAPVVPVFPAGQSVTTSGLLRYEDLTQDGRLLPIAIPPAMGGLWREVLVAHPGSRNAIAQGIVPILTRLTITSFDQAIRVDRGTAAYSGFLVARDAGPAEVTRLYMNIWCSIRGTAARSLVAAQPGELVPAGALFAEHVFTRPMAPAERRRVTQLNVDGYPSVPELRYAGPAPSTAQDAPDGATWQGDLVADPAEYVFTLDQTDSNQHVNSLVYIRLFLEAVNRRLAATGRPLRVRSKAVDIAYRKPSFAGDRVRAHVRLFEGDGTHGAAGFVAADGEKPRCFVRVLLGP